MARTPEQMAVSIRRQTNRQLDALVDEVMLAHENREDQCTTLPLKRRGGPIFRRPKTALIAYAAQRAAMRKQLQQIIKWGVEQSGAPPYVVREDYTQVVSFMGKVLERLQSAEEKR